MKVIIIILVFLCSVFLTPASVYAGPSENSDTNPQNENVTFTTDFTAFPVSGVAPLVVDFEDNSSSEATIWEWDFDSDGTIDSNKENPEPITFTNPGNYDVTLRASNGVVWDNITKPDYITVSVNKVGELPESSFTASPTEGKAPLTVQFTDRSTGNVTSWQWDFGDGETSKAQNPYHTYKEAGIYKANLTVSNTFGSDTPDSPVFINVSSSSAPIAEFKSDITSGKAPLRVQFSDLSTGSPTAWQWDFNSDGNFDSREQNPVYEFKSPGTYTVILKAGNENGWSDIKKENYITIEGDDLKAGFMFSPAEGKAPLTVQFTDTSTGGATAWFWDFGDSFTSSSRNPSHIYSKAGTYTVKLTVTDGSRSNTLEAPSSVNVLSINDPIVNPPDTPNNPNNPSTPTNPGTPSTPTNPGTPSTPTNPGTPSTPTNPGTPSTPTNPGTSGIPNDPDIPDAPTPNTPETPVETPVNPPVIDSPIVDFRSNITSGKAPLTVQFEDNSGGNPVAWEWDFNSDGQVDSREENPVYEFKDVGTYSVTLRAGNGASWGNITKTNYIIVGDGFQVSFTAFPIEGQVPLTVKFTDTSTGNITSWLWDFGDGNISTFQNPIHTYYETGKYSVTLNASNTAFTWTDYITVIEEGESSGGSSGGSDTEEWDYSGTSSGTGSSSGGGGSPEPASNVYTSVLNQKYVAAGSRVRFDFVQNATSIDFVEFDAKRTLGKTAAIIEQLKGRSVLTPFEPGGTIYRYINIWVGNEDFARSENIGNATIGFRISKTEIPVNETGNSTVYLQRYSNGGWNALDTQKTGEDNRYIYFQARTPGFSPFAITFGRTTVIEPQRANETFQTAPQIPESQVENKPPEESKSFFQNGLISDKDWPVFSSAIGPFIGLMLILFIGLAVREKIK